jgi:hypothetical protein
VLGITSISAIAAQGEDPELKNAAQQAVEINQSVDRGLNPACKKCEAIAGVLPEVHKTIPLFRETKPIELEITTDFDRLAALPVWGVPGDFGNKKNLQAGNLQYLDDDGKPHVLPVKVALRGNAKQVLCEWFKPLRVTFDQNQDLSATPFKGISEDFKIATHCNGKGKVPDSSGYVQQMLREYTAYKALEALGFMSLKVRLAQIKYKKPNGEIYAEAKAFILEPKSNMAKRYGKKQIKQEEADQAEKLTSSQLLPFDFSIQFLTQHDSKKDGSHNGILVTEKGSRKPDSIVPYDFDLAEMVQFDKFNVSPWDHGVPNDREWLRRKFKESQNPQEVEKVARYALAHKDAVMKVINESPAQELTWMKKRVEVFFDGIEKALKEREAQQFPPPDVNP